jgi:hypothetical protein
MIPVDSSKSLRVNRGPNSPPPLFSILASFLLFVALPEIRNHPQLPSGSQTAADEISIPAEVEVYSFPRVACM